jgi:hypothetical protein
VPPEQHERDSRADSVRGGPSPLELFHPDGAARSIVVCGTGPASCLATTTGDVRPALVLLAPSALEGRDPQWLDEAVEIAASVADDGLVVGVRASRRLLGYLRARGLVEDGRLLHSPDVPRSRYIAPLGGVAASFAVRRLIPMHPLKRAAATALFRAGAPMPARTSVVLRPPGSRPLLAWLGALRSARASCSGLVAGSWRAGGAIVVFRFGDGGFPDAVVKIGDAAVREARALRALGRGACIDGIAVPEVLEEGLLVSTPLAVQTPMPGLPATRVVQQSPGQARGLLEALAGWLREWNARSACRRPYSPDDAERLVLGPVRRLSPALRDGPERVGRLVRLSEDCLGVTIPFVAAHNDLTAANILVANGGKLAIVDWEAASEDALPLGDLAYAAADLAAAVGGYRDRPRAFESSFAPGGAFADLTAGLLDEAARSLALDARVLELCLHACWLMHAENEAAVVATEESDRPFLELLQRFGDLRARA